MAQAEVLSVVVTVVESGPTLNRCLAALAAQTIRDRLEVIVPYDDTIADVAQFGAIFPWVRFVPMGRLSSPGDLNAFDQHGLYERRRAAGLRAATGGLVAMLEDRGRPHPDWAAAMVDLHARTPSAAIGGVIGHSGRGALRWALFFCDFGRYQPGMPEGEVEYLSDVNICYKREALESVRDLWDEIYQEATVNWALRRSGCELRLSRAPIVTEERVEARYWPVIRERMHWARIFAHVRGREAPSRMSCLAWAAASPLLPALLFVRHARRQLTLGRYLGEFVRAAPATLLLLHCWAFGECIGYCEAALKRHLPG